MRFTHIGMVLKMGRINPRQSMKIELNKFEGMEYNSHKENEARKK